MTNPIATVGVLTTYGPVDVIAEIISEDIAITPEFGHDKDGNTGLTGAFQITHRASGRSFGGSSSCIACARRSAKAMAEMNIDFTRLGESREDNNQIISALSRDDYVKFGILRDPGFGCDSDYCDEDGAES